MQIHFEGLDGIEGPMYIGTGCIHRRVVLYGRERRNSSSNLNRPYFTGCTENGSTTKDRAGPSKKLQKEARVLANCTFEENTLWGKEAILLCFLLLVVIYKI